MAEIVTQTVEYDHNGTVLEGYLAYDNSMTAPRPGVLVIHQWMGLSEYEQERARMLAELGYVAFAVDVYGKGVRPANREEAAAQAGKYRGDRALMRARLQAGLDHMRTLEMVDNSRIAAIGYCFGGGAALELARDGADIAGVVSFHGNLDTPNAEDANNITGKVLVCHGAIDPHVPMQQVEAFLAEMEAARVDYQLVMYGGAVHSFTDFDAGSDVSAGAAYDEDADRRSWGYMLQFFGGVFGE
jgi:dienelactone hydrolase